MGVWSAFKILSAHLVVEPEIINLDFGATETFTVTPLDSFGNELDVVDVLDSPYWVVKVDDLDLEIELGTLIRHRI